MARAAIVAVLAIALLSPVAAFARPRRAPAVRGDWHAYQSRHPAGSKGCDSGKADGKSKKHSRGKSRAQGKPQSSGCRQ
jgi:hypothetical protein